MIEVKNISKYYGTKVGVKDINFTVESGEIVGLLGPNGSGKSTTMKMITGYMPPSEGTIVVDGYDILDKPKEVTNRIGFLPEIPPLYPEMQVNEFLSFIARIKGVDKRRLKSHVNDVMEMTSITHVKERLIRNLSKGYRQRVGLAQAIISDPPILIFDEPTVGLDPKQINEVRQLIRKLGEAHTVILSSHILAEASMICERVVILNKGRIAAVDTTENLAMGMADTGRFLLKLKGDVREVEQVLETVEGIIGIEPIDNERQNLAGYCGFIITNERDTEVREPLFYAMSRKGIPIMELRSIGMTLEEIFLQLTSEKTDEGKELQV